MNKKLLISILLLIMLGFFFGYNYLYQDHKDIATSDIEEHFTAAQLMNLFTDDDTSNDVKALDKVIAVQGKVTSSQDDELTIDKNIFIKLNQPQKTKVNSTITIKGRCLGYDDLMQEVKIDQAILYNP